MLTWFTSAIQPTRLASISWKRVGTIRSRRKIGVREENADRRGEVGKRREEEEMMRGEEKEEEED